MRTCVLNENHWGGVLHHESRTYELKAIQASSKLIEVNEMAESDFNDLVNEYRQKVESTFAKRDSVSADESSYYRPTSKYYAFHLTAPADIFSELEQNGNVGQITQMGMMEPAGHWRMARQIPGYEPISQADSPDHLKTLSWDGQSRTPRDYAYDPRAGKGSHVFIVDTGSLRITITYTRLTCQTRGHG
jgi:hypothetical protein